MKLKIENKAPEFMAQSLSGKNVALKDYRNKNLLIKFYRFATCPVCSLHLRSFVTQYDKLSSAGLSVVAIYHSPTWRMEKNMSHDLPFEVLSDPDKKIFRNYGVASSLMGMFSYPVMRDYVLALKAGFSPGMRSSDGGITGQPADFLVDKEGTIRYTHYGRNYADSLTVNQVLKIAEENLMLQGPLGKRKSDMACHSTSIAMND